MNSRFASQHVKSVCQLLTRSGLLEGFESLLIIASSFSIASLLASFGLIGVDFDNGHLASPFAFSVEDLARI